MNKRYVLVLSGIVEGGAYSGRIQLSPSENCQVQQDSRRVILSDIIMRSDTSSDMMADTDMFEGLTNANLTAFGERLTAKFDA